MIKCPSLRNIQEWTTKQVLSRQVATQPDKVAVSFIGGLSWTYKELELEVKATAARMQARGIGSGDRVALLLKNSPEFLRCWLATHYCGAVSVGLNTELKGSFLAHALDLSDAVLLIADEAFRSNIESLQDSTELNVVYTGESGSSSTPNREEAASCYEDIEPRYGDLAGLMFTSGTTGPSKAVMMPHAHCYLYGLGTIEHGELSSQDSYYITMPLFHANALFMQLYACLIRGATAYIREKFSASNWVSDLVETQATHTNLLGVMSEFITRQPKSENDRSHQLRTIFAAPCAESTIENFKLRLGVEDMRELYGMSEVNIPLYTPKGAAKPASCGKVYDDYFEVRIADPKTDLDVEDGQLGEIQVRPKLASAFMSGYFRMPEKTVEAWQNLWFHTGDAGIRDTEGYYYFKDRIKDSIRRRGENISSFEVESAIANIDGVSEVAVIAVPSDIEGGEDEVMAVVCIEGEHWNPEWIMAQAQQHVPKFAVPRYWRRLVAKDFPRTATNKIKKQALRDQGIVDGTWDAQRAKATVL